MRDGSALYGLGVGFTPCFGIPIEPFSAFYLGFPY